ncbi:hypothetical protein AK830_g3525 [Neonectria ditissima]|uniref:DUF7770 domain-containing protein n=1 Tax=Neonectria ditissima TaxID=78410 RepID=A0A0P7BQA1_9HYPO|nr:hypothetical protein AK830_g3525 [Neonectria ditissima]
MGCSMSSIFSKGGEGTPSHTNFELEKFDPLSYTPELSKNHIRSRPVSAVHIVAHSVLLNGGNHWHIYLQTGEEEFVCLEASPGAFPGREGFLARIDIVEHAYALTYRPHKIVSIPAKPGHSVASFLDAIVQADNHRYEFTREGRGCGGWVRGQFYLFVQVGLLPPGWENTFETAINVAWENEVSQGPWPVTYGTYLRDR